MAHENQSSINLIAGRKEAVHKERVVSAKTQFLSIVILIAFAALLVGVFSVRGMVAYKQKTVAEAISDEELRLAQLRPVEEKYVVLANKLKLIDDYLTAKGEMLTQADSLFRGVSPGVTISTVTVGVDEGSVVLSGMAKDYIALLARLDQLEQEAETKLFTKATLTGIGRDATGAYTANTEYQLEN